MINLTLRRSCRFCSKQELRPSTRELWQYTLEPIGLRPYYCRHCRDVYWRVRPLIPALLLLAYSLTYVGLRYTSDIAHRQHNRPAVVTDSFVFAPARLVERFVRPDPAKARTVPTLNAETAAEPSPETH